MRALVRVLLPLALVAAACGDGAGPATTAPPPIATTETTTGGPATSAPTTTAPTPTTPVATAPPIPAGSAWSRVPDDWEVFGGYGRIAMRSVIAGGPGLVAVGWDESPGFSIAAVWTSADGLSWTRVGHDDDVFGAGEPGGIEMLSVTAGGPGLVAVGRDGSAGELGAAAVWTSSDGHSWTRVPHDEGIFGGPGGQEMESVVAAGPGLVAVGRTEDASQVGRPAVWTSTDGRRWALSITGTDVARGSGAEAMHTVASGAPGLVAAGRAHNGSDWDGAVWTSADGLTWNRVPHHEDTFGGPDYQWMSSVIAGGPGFVIVGWEGTTDQSVAAVWTSADGLTWNRVLPDEAVFGGPGRTWMNAVVAGGPGLVAVGFSDDGEDGSPTRAAAWTSEDGLTWTRVPHDEAAFGGPGDQTMSSVVLGGPGLVAVGSADGMDRAAVWLSPPPD
jgi:hypothetical protein